MRAALRALIEDDSSLDDTSMDGSDTAEPDEEIEDLPDAIWDDTDGVFRCFNLQCGWEVVDGICQSCASHHHLSVVSCLCISLAKLTAYNTTQDETKFEDSIDNEAYMSDRRLVQRGTTPLSEVGIESIPEEYGRQWNGVEAKWEDGREVEYLALLQRGATRLMCETFHLEFTIETGIVAWADSRVYETFAGPGMQEGDFWKIYLGRRIWLDPEDLDGFIFLEGILEDALFYPLETPTTPVECRWYTYEEGPGIWATRPLFNMNAVTDEESGSVDEVSLEDVLGLPLAPKETQEQETQEQAVHEDTEQAKAQDDSNAAVKSADQYESDEDDTVDVYQSDWEIDPYSSDNTYDPSDGDSTSCSTDDGDEDDEIGSPASA